MQFQAVMGVNVHQYFRKTAGTTTDILTVFRFMRIASHAVQKKLTRNKKSVETNIEHYQIPKSVALNYFCAQYAGSNISKILDF